MLVVDLLRAGYQSREVLHEVSMSVGDRSITAVVGANGAGKSTLLRALSGRIAVRAGSVSLDGCDLTTAPPHVRARAGLCHIAEGGGLFRTLTVLENLRLFGCGAGEDVDRIVGVFPRLSALLRRTAGTLSGGGQQMVALSRAWASRRNLVLIDELSLGLAHELVDELMSAAAGLPRRGTSVVLVEQHMDRVLEVADELVLLQRGTVTWAGPRERVDPGVLEACLLGEPFGDRSHSDRARPSLDRLV